MSKKDIQCCPHCGSTEGLYTKTTLVNVPYRFGFNNEPQINTEMYDNAEKTVGGETAYCQECHKPVCRMSKLRKQWGEGVFHETVICPNCGAIANTEFCFGCNTRMNQEG